MKTRIMLLAIFILTISTALRSFQKVGEKGKKGILVATGQWIRPAGKTLAFAGRPVDLAVAPDGRTLYAKEISGILVIDVASWKIRQELKFENGGGSMHGIAVAHDGKSVYVTDADSSLLQISVGDSGRCTWDRKITLPGFDHEGSYPCGVALRLDDSRAYVALSRNNTVAVVNLQTGVREVEIPTGVAPYDVVLSPDGKIAFVSNWGGRKARAGEHVMASTGTDVVVNERNIPSTGTISKIDLAKASTIADVDVGLHPSDLELSRDGSRLYCANANSDNISVLSAEPFRNIRPIPVRVDTLSLFGSIPNALAMSPDEHTLYAADGGSNSVSVIGLPTNTDSTFALRGLIPSGWFPAAVATSGGKIFIAGAKGEGSRAAEGPTDKWHVKWNRGTISLVEAPTASALVALTKEVREQASIYKLTGANARTHSSKPVPVPARVGEPSVFQHVVYVLKENRTYDQIFGDIHRGNSDPRLCIYGRSITPNHHAIADAFVLLDNYYCNGIVSADGHQWATQGVTTDYQEKTFGMWTRSYDFGTDPLAFAQTEFIWENALLHGKTFRNYGEFDFPVVEPGNATWSEIYRDHERGEGKIALRQSILLEPLRKFTAPTYPGWDLRISDALRMDAFIKEFAGYEKRGDWPNLVLVYLPQDHTSGKKADYPRPEAHLADNDLALGRLLQAISKSRFWPTTCVFVNEDDPQDGFDHVDGHRSICLVASPYTKRGKVVSKFYNQTSVLHTIERILGLPPMNTFDASAPTMEECFTAKPDLTPFTSLPNTVPLDEMNKRASLLDPNELREQKLSDMFDFTRPDRVKEDDLNRILWHEAKGYGASYPARYAGAHGRGLRSLRLKAEPDVTREEK